MDALQKPGAQDNFRDYISQLGPQGILGNRDFDIRGMLQGLQSKGILPGQGQSFGDFTMGEGGPSGMRSLVNEMLGGGEGADNLARNLIYQTSLQNINPAAETRSAGIGGPRDQQLPRQESQLAPLRGVHQAGIQLAGRVSYDQPIL